MRPHAGDFLYVTLAAGDGGLTRGEEGSGAVRPGPGSRVLGFSDSCVRVLGARRCRAAGYSGIVVRMRKKRLSELRSPHGPAGVGAPWTS